MLRKAWHWICKGIEMLRHSIEELGHGLAMARLGKGIARMSFG